MTLAIVIRTIEGIAVATDTVSTADTRLELNGEKQDVEYHVYMRRKLSRIGDFAIVHAGLSYLNKKTINQIVDRIPIPNDITVDDCIKTIKDTLVAEIKADNVVKQLENNRLILSIGIIGYKNDDPFVYRMMFFRNTAKGKLFDIEDNSDEAFTDPRYGIDYFGDYDFVRLVIKAALEEKLMKPFYVLTLNEALDLARILIKFLIEFQKYLVQFTVAFPIESAVINLENGFQWVDKMEFKKLDYNGQLT